MRETPAQFNEALQRSRSEQRASRPGQRSSRYPMESLARYRYHTGARIKPLKPDELCPVLFRDIGPIAMARFLRGELTRLAGPYTPITYMRTEHYQEPYVDYGTIGRLVFLRPLEVEPWHSGVEHIYVARATRMTSPETLGYIPGDISLDEASQLIAEAPDTATLREIMGGHQYDQRCADALAHLDRLNDSLAQTETSALPLRKLLQSSQTDDTMRAREIMARFGIDESDLCAAWHHLPQARRDALEDAFARAAEVL